MELFSTDAKKRVMNRCRSERRIRRCMNSAEQQGGGPKSNTACFQMDEREKGSPKGNLKRRFEQLSKSCYQNSQGAQTFNERVRTENLYPFNRL